jgi:hypothetical protein
MGREATRVKIACGTSEGAGPCGTRPRQLGNEADGKAERLRSQGRRLRLSDP